MYPYRLRLIEKRGWVVRGKSRCGDGMKYYMGEGWGGGVGGLGRGSRGRGQGLGGFLGKFFGVVEGSYG